MKMSIENHFVIDGEKSFKPKLETKVAQKIFALPLLSLFSSS